MKRTVNMIVVTLTESLTDLNIETLWGINQSSITNSAQP